MPPTGMASSSSTTSAGSARSTPSPRRMPLGPFPARQAVSPLMRQGNCSPRLRPHERQVASVTTRKLPSTEWSGRMVQGPDRLLLTMATGTGKTVVAFQICWKLWNRGGTVPRAPEASAARAFCIWPIATSWSMIPRRTDFAAFRRSPLQDRGRQRSKAARCTSPPTRPSRRTNAAPASTASYPPDFFDLIIVRRVPSRQRPRRQQLAGDSQLLRAGVSARHDRHAAPAG